VRPDRKRPAVLITDAGEDPEKEVRRREIRYVIMMLTRAACLVLGAVLVTTRPPLWPLWLVLCIVGMVLLPWLAVLLANDRPPKTRAERKAAERLFHEATPGLTAPDPDRVIDVDEYEYGESEDLEYDRNPAPDNGDQPSQPAPTKLAPGER
jgi:hypothetical protein